MTAGPGSTRSYGWRLGSIGGIPIYLGRSWPIIGLVVVLTFGPAVPTPRGERGGAFGFTVAIAYAVLLLLSVLAHEAAHALAARRFGFQVDRVVADLWGGHTVYNSTSSRPGASAGIAIAGPATNLLIGALGYACQGFAPDGVVGLLLGAVTWTNVFVGVFNLLPGLPLDGGFLVDALVWKVTGDRNRGLIVAGWLGRILTVCVLLWFVVRPLLVGGQPSLLTIIWGALIGAFLWVGATNAIRAGTSRRLIQSVPLAQVLRPALVVGAREPVASVLARVTPALGPVWVPAGGEAQATPPPAVVVLGDGGRPVGLVDVDAARTIEPVRSAQVPVEAVVSRQPDGWVVPMPSRDADISAVVSAIAMREGPVPTTLLAMTSSGEVLGTVSLADLNAAFSR